MKPFRLLVSLVALVVAARAETWPELRPPVPANPEILAATDAAAAWKPVGQMSDPVYLQQLLGDISPAERVPVMLKLNLRAIADASAFITRFPQDPRRWDALTLLAQSSRTVAQPDGTLRPPFTASAGLGWDQTAWVAWLQQLAAWESQVLAAPDASPAAKFAVEIQQPGGLMSKAQVVNQARQKRQPFDVAPLRTEMMRLAEAYPQLETIGAYLSGYIMLYAESGVSAEQVDAELKVLAASPNASVQKTARKEIEKRERLTKPLEIAFTAVDGRAVDLQALRGKVVLVDFWGTWCGPCIAELPSVKKAYAAYHDKGFEIIGIALENAQLRPNDTPEQTAEKLARAKKVLTDFTAKEQMPWPQYFDGKFWKNDLSTRYGINSIPAMFLLDQTGKLVTTDARGEKLEAEVKRLLKL